MFLGLKLCLGVRGRKVLEGLDFGGICPHALGNENCAIKGNLRLLDMALSTVEDDTMVPGSPHQAQEVLIIILGGTAEYSYMVMNGDNAR